MTSPTPITPADPANRDLLNTVCTSVRRTVAVCGPEWAIPALSDLARAHVEVERNVRWPNVSWIASTAKPGELRTQAREARDAATALSQRFARLYRDDRAALLGYLDTMIALTARDAAPAREAA